MGVRGFQSFVDTNSDLSQNFELHDCQLIFDGSNLAHYLYLSTSTLHQQYGGDYNKFSKLIKEYFSSFKACNVTPIVVFDGGYDRSGCKIPNVHKRHRKILKNVKDFTNMKSKMENVPPILLIDVFQSVLKDLGITILQSAYEADNEIASLANYLQCPLTSQDSDFYIYHLDHGCIRLDSINTDVKERKTKEGTTQVYLKTKIYYSKNLKQLFPNLETDLLTLFSTLIGNDLTQTNTFDQFFSHVKLPKKKTRRRIMNKNHIKMIGLLEWLQHKQINEAIKNVLGFLSKDCRDKAKNVIEVSMNNYKMNNLYLSSHMNDEPSSATILRTLNDKELPDWFVSNFHRGELPSTFCNAVSLRQVFFKPQVEDFLQESSYSPALEIRKQIYHILLQYDKGESKVPPSLVEWDRKESNLGKTLIDIDLSLTDYPKLEEIPSMNETLRQDFIIRALGADKNILEGVPDNLKLFMLTLFYYNKHAKPAPHYVKSLILSYIYCYLLKLYEETDIPKSNNCSSIKWDSLDLESILTRICYKEAHSALENLQKYATVPSTSKFSRHDLSLLHSYCQFQACFAWIVYLNKLMNEGFTTPKAQSLLNGTLICNLSKALHGRTELSTFISNLLGEGTCIEALFNKLKSCFLLREPITCSKKLPTIKKKSKYCAPHIQSKNHIEIDPSVDILL